MEAIAFTPPDRTETLARQFLSRADSPDDDDEAAALSIYALALAADLAIFAPSSSGATAIDRYLRGHPPAGGEKTEAAQALRRARFRVIRIEACDETSRCRGIDLATGEPVAFHDDGTGRERVGSTLATRLCPLGGGDFVTTGPTITLNDDSLAVARGFMRPNGKGMVNPERCAEAVYRHVVRHDGVPDDILATLNDVFDEPELFPYGPETGPISELAHRWAEQGGDPSPADLAAARGHASPDHLIDAVELAGLAADFELPALSAAFERIAVIQIETMRRRKAVSARAPSIDDVARLIDDEIRAGTVSPETRARFEDLRRRAGAASRGKPGDANLDRLLQVIQGLRAKTVDQGCTEAEAMAAAAKVAELLDRYGLSLSDVEFRRQSCESVGIATTRRRTGPIDHTVPHIAAFFDCRCWTEKTANDTLGYVFFGLPGDVEAAQYLYELVERTFETETAAFRTGDFYRGLHSSARRDGTGSFQMGLARGIIAKLDTLRQEREAALHRSSGRDLMVVKASIVDEEVDRLGLAFTYKPIGGKRYVMTDAYAAGQEAGERFDYRPGIGR